MACPNEGLGSLDRAANCSTGAGGLSHTLSHRLSHMTYGSAEPIVPPARKGHHVLVGRHLRQINPTRPLGIVCASSGEFVVPDCPLHYTFVPVTPTLALVSPAINQQLDWSAVGLVNEELRAVSRRYFFAKNLSAWRPYSWRFGNSHTKIGRPPGWWDMRREVSPLSCNRARILDPGRGLFWETVCEVLI